MGTNLPAVDLGVSTVTPTPTTTPMPTATPTSTPTATRTPVIGPTINIVNFAFQPDAITVYSGEVVRWVNSSSSTTHNVRSPGLWDSGPLAPGVSYSIEVVTPGVYVYTSSLYPSMSGSITVLDVAVTATPTSMPTSTSTATPTPTPTATPTPTPSLPTPRLSGLSIANVSDASFSVLWRTDLVVSGTVRYGIIDADGAPVTLALVPDVRGTSFAGRTHFVQVGGVDPATGQVDGRYNLAPNTEYWIAVLGADPEVPLAPRTVRTGPLLSPGEPDSRFGVVRDGMGNPVPNALVHVTIADANGAPTPGVAAVLATVANGQGLWYVDLGRARTADLSAPFVYTGTDSLRPFADAGDGRMGFTTASVGAGSLLSLTVAAVVPHGVAYGPGWHALALPVRPVTATTLGELAVHLNGDGQTRLLRAYRYDSEGWQGALITSTSVFGADFPLVPGEGFFLAMAGYGTWGFFGYPLAQPPTQTLQAGWNLIGVPVSANRLRASDIVASAGQRPEDGGYRIREVDRWAFGGYEGHIAGYPFNDFPIEPDRAYFVQATETLQWSAPVTGTLGISTVLAARGW